MIRRAGAIAALGLLLAALAAGCGGGGSGSGEVAASGAKSVFGELSEWFNGARPAISEIDQGEISATRLHVSKPPPVNDLLLISRPGVTDGRAAQGSARDLYQVTDLTSQEVKGLYCFLFSWYVQHGTIPTEPDGFEEAFFSYLRGRVLPSTPPQRLQGIANLFRESIVKAQNEGEGAARVAVATVCSLPSG
jgi:hypothetical protein